MEAIMAHLSRQQISDFFSKTAPITQQQCDQEAERITGGSVQPAPVQGGASYTVLADDGTLVVQFRAGRSALDLDLVGYIKQTYGSFVPRHDIAGRLGELHVYTMDNVGGVAMYLARERLHQHNCYLLRQTVQDFASFFASAWHNTPSSMPCPSRNSLFSQYSSQLSELVQGLPDRFRPSLEYLTAQLPRLFVEDWPLVPNHNDLLENNIHVNPETGQIVGICDWRDTTIGPFGMSLGGLETMLGIRRMRGWCYHLNQQELRDLFWVTFYNAIGKFSEELRDLIEVARLVGIFIENGFEGDGNGNRVPASEGNETLDYLGAVTLGVSAYTEQNAKLATKLSPGGHQAIVSS
ncbi:hypothetical protein F66182_10745 [Fusarium sp. NRRL 66182]|nr:hypothetical protein F66182_10745 [Fusarium sp. NRRL 66182]